MHLLFDHFNQLTQTPENLKSLRQWIIDLGVRGQLTQAWRKEHPAIEPASVLLEKINAEKAKLVKEKKMKKAKLLPPIAAGEIPYNLPESWVWCRLASITNYGISKKVEPEDILPETWVLDLEDVVKGTNELLGRHAFSERDSQSTKNVFNAGDVLYSKLRPYLDKVIVADQIGVCTTEILPLTPEDGINAYYLRLSLKSKRFQTYVNSVTKGMKMPRLGTNEGRMAVLSLPPLAEQQAIVGKVESLLVKVSRLQERAGEVEASKAQVGQSVCGWLADAPLGGETARRFRSVAPQFDEVFSTLPNLKALRQTILQLAIQGKLTEAWRATHPEAEPASALLERIQAEKARLVKEKIKKPNRTTDRPLPPIIGDEVPFDLPEGWVWCRLGEVALYSEAGKSLKCSEVPVVGNQWGIIKVSAVSWGVFKETENKFYSSEPPVEVSSKIEAGDFLLSRANTKELVGRSVVVSLCDFNLLLSDKTIRYKFNGLINLSYINLCNNSTESRIYYSRVATGSSPSMKNITRGQMNELYIPLPPLAEQQAIVEKVESLLAKVSALEQEVEQNRQYAEQLLQSVLREVMQGSHSSKEATS